MQPFSIFHPANQASIRLFARIWLSMKLVPILTALSLGSLLIACDSLDSPLRSVANIGHDERVYNSSTGHYEWPDDLASQQKQKREKAASAAMPKATPSPTKTDAEKQKLAQVKIVPSAPRKVESTPAPALARPPAELDSSASPAAASPTGAPLFPQ